MNAQQMREKLRHHYGGPKAPFSKKLDKMSDRQVIAIYHRLLERGVIK